MNAKQAIQIARLWRAGKMIGWDKDEVIDGLLTEIERITKVATEAHTEITRQIDIMRSHGDEHEAETLEEHREPLKEILTTPTNHNN